MSRNSLYVNGEGYVDNTAGKALRNIQRKRKEVGVNYKAQIIGRNSKKSGETFERWISTACKFYLNKCLSLEEGTLFNMNLYTQKAKVGIMEKMVDLRAFLSLDEQLPIREAFIQALEEKREEHTINFQEAIKEFEKLAKEAQR